MNRRLHAVLLGCVLALVAARARAEERAMPLTWHANWPKFRSSEYVATGVLGEAALGAIFFLDDAEQPRWRGGILLDDAARVGLRARSAGGRDTARAASDVLAASTASLLLGVDSLVVPVARGHADIAQQLEWMNAEAFALSLLIRTTLVKTIGRARPSYADCTANPDFDPLCEDSKTASFPSGHTTAAFTAAGLACAHHTHLALYGDRARDDAACGLSLLLATATGTLRVVGDRHYLSDVVAGAILGFAVGFGLPLCLHYRGGTEHDVQTARLGLGATSPRSIAWSGTF